MLFIIGLGLNSYKDLSLRSLEILKLTQRVYLENYTCIQAKDLSELETLLGFAILPANRLLVEETNQIVEEAIGTNVVFLVVGTPLFATTHTDLIIRAKERNVPVKIIHNISILNVKGCYGLYSYNFGRTVTIPYFTERVKPLSFYDHIFSNFEGGLHTLCLLDIKTDENRFMRINEALEELLYAEEEKKKGIITKETKVFAVCRFATEEEAVWYDTIEELIIKDFGNPLHSLIIPGKLSCIEEEFIGKLFS